MSPRSRSAWRRRIRRSRKTQVAVTAVVSVAIVVVAVVAISLVDKGISSVNQAAFGNCASGAAAQASDGPNADPSAAPATPCPTQTATTQAAPRVPITLSDFATGPIATRQLGDVATNPVDGTGAAISLNQSPDQASQFGQLHPVGAVEPADRAGPGYPVQARRRLLHGQPGTAGLRRGDDPVAQRPGPGVQPADHHPGHQARAPADRAADPAGLAGHTRLRVQRHQPGAHRPRCLPAARAAAWTPLASR